MRNLNYYAVRQYGDYGRLYQRQLGFLFFVWALPVLTSWRRYCP